MELKTVNLAIDISDSDWEKMSTIIASPTGDVLKRELLRSFFPGVITMGPQAAFGYVVDQKPHTSINGGSGLEGSLGMNTISGGNVCSKEPPTFILDGEKCVTLMNAIAFSGISRSIFSQRMYSLGVKSRKMPEGGRMVCILFDDYLKVTKNGS